MDGMSEREYSGGSGLSRGAIQKVRKAGRLVVFGDGKINAAASEAHDRRRRTRTNSAGRPVAMADFRGQLTVRLI